MKKLLAIALSSIIMLASLFADDYQIKVSSPSGAPGLALATLAEKKYRSPPRRHCKGRVHF